MRSHLSLIFFFFFNDTATTEIYTLSLHDALPISSADSEDGDRERSTEREIYAAELARSADGEELVFTVSGRSDRKSTRLNSSHLVISYAVFCLKKKTRNILRQCYGDKLNRDQPFC